MGCYKVWNTDFEEVGNHYWVTQTLFFQLVMVYIGNVRQCISGTCGDPNSERLWNLKTLFQKCVFSPVGIPTNEFWKNYLSERK